MDEQKIKIEHVFDAPKELVWKTWTDPEIVKKWWGPSGFTAPSIKIDLKVGGKYIYAMQGPKGSEWDKVMYSSGIFKEIVEGEKIITTDYFSDSEGNKLDPKDFGQDANFPKEMTVTILFQKLDGDKTKLSIIYDKPETEEQFQTMLNSGMREGWSSSLDKLAESLK